MDVLKQIQELNIFNIKPTSKKPKQQTKKKEYILKDNSKETLINKITIYIKC